MLIKKAFNNTMTGIYLKTKLHETCLFDLQTKTKVKRQAICDLLIEDYTAAVADSVKDLQSLLYKLPKPYPTLESLTV